MQRCYRKCTYTYMSNISRIISSRLFSLSLFSIVQRMTINERSLVLLLSPFQDQIVVEISDQQMGEHRELFVKLVEAFDRAHELIMIVGSERYMVDLKRCTDNLDHPNYSRTTSGNTKDRPYSLMLRHPSSAVSTYLRYPTSSIDLEQQPSSERQQTSEVSWSTVVLVRKCQ